MNGSLKPVSEPLYLDRDDNDDIFVESSLHQHHIDGIRFLYKQYKKKNLGVIINNPLGYGNSLQVALFLGAIRHVLDKPILILCEQSKELNWLEHFQKLTQCYNVGVGATSPFVKKSIFINTLERLEQFSRRDWSVLVVDNDDFLREKLQASFRADLKIWITPLDMRNNLETFSSIYKWIFPKNKFNIEDFKAKPGNRIDAISKSILLEAFLENIVCRTTLQTPFENPFDKSGDTPRKVSKKNKDATGTKIKRSKKSSDVANTSTGSEKSDLESGASAAKIPRTETASLNISNISDNEDNKKCDDDSKKSDVETCIRDEEPIKFDPFNEFDNISHNSHESRTEFMDDEPMFDTADRLNRLLETNVPMDIAANPEYCFIDSDTNSDSLLPIPKTDDTSQHSNDSVYERKRTTLDYLTDNFFNEIKEEMSEMKSDEELDKSPESVKEDTNKDKEEADNVAGNLDIDEENTGIVKENTDIVKEITDIAKENTDKIKEKTDVNNESSIDVKADSDIEEPDVEMKEADKIKESPSKNLDAKLKEMDERAFKKFQGSILDSLF